MIDSLVLNRSTQLLLPHLRIWEGWKIRIPINTVGLATAVHKKTHEMVGEYFTEVGTNDFGEMGKGKVHLTLICSSDLLYTSCVDLVEKAFALTNRDGDVAILAPLTWASSDFVREKKAVGSGGEAHSVHPDIFVCSEKADKKTLAWFVWSRDRKQSWRHLEAVEAK